MDQRSCSPNERGDQCLSRHIGKEILSIGCRLGHSAFVLRPVPPATAEMGSPLLYCLPRGLALYDSLEYFYLTLLPVIPRESWVSPMSVL